MKDHCISPEYINFFLQDQLNVNYHSLFFGAENLYEVVTSSLYTSSTCCHAANIPLEPQAIREEPQFQKLLV